MRLIVAGGRDYDDIEKIHYHLCLIRDRNDIEMVITGGCQGVDNIAHQWAWKNGIQTCLMQANWHMHGKSAGPMRNLSMANLGTHLIAFPGGRGTANMVNYAKQYKLNIKTID